MILGRRGAMTITHACAILAIDNWTFRPTQQTYIRSNKESLLEECRFSCVEDFELRISGRTVSNDLRPPERRLKKQEDELRASSDVHPSEKYEAGSLIDVFCQDSSPLDPLGLGLPILRNQGCTRPKMKCEN